MTKADIVNEISKNTGIEKAVVLETVEKFMESVKGSLAKGENVYDPAHPERNTPESFIQANAETSEGHAVEAGIDNRINTIKHSNEEEH